MLQHADPEARVPPIWPINPSSLLVDDAVYEVDTVPSSSIAIVTSRFLKVAFYETFECDVNIPLSLILMPSLIVIG